MKVPKKYKEKLKNKLKKKKEKIKSPSLSKRFKNFTVSAIKHIAKGMPTCTQEEIDERLEICKGCKWFNGESCRKCGCVCNNNKKFLNKLAWADQKCPLDKWGKIEKEKEEE